MREWCPRCGRKSLIRLAGAIKGDRAGYTCGNCGLGFIISSGADLERLARSPRPWRVTTSPTERSRDPDFGLSGWQSLQGRREAPIIDREHVKGAADKIKGSVKDTAGKVTGDEKMQAEGKMDKAKGAAHNAAGDAKDTASDATR